MPIKFEQSSALKEGPERLSPFFRLRYPSPIGMYTPWPPELAYGSGSWRGPFCILAQSLECVFVILSWLHELYISSAMAKKKKKNPQIFRCDELLIFFINFLLEWKNICSMVLVLCSLLERKHKMLKKSIHFKTLRSLFCMCCFRCEGSDVKEMR